MSPIPNAQLTTAMEITYSDAISIAMNHPPLEPGAYGVQYFDGSTGSEIWNGENWVDSTHVARYSGRPFLLTREEKKQQVDRILAALDSRNPSGQNRMASESALALARHYALKVEKNRTGSKVGLHIQAMLGFYLLAKNFGMNFAMDNSATRASITDKKLLAWASQDIAAQDRDRIEEITGNALQHRAELQAWLKDLVA